MSADFTTTGLIAKVIRRGFLPPGGALSSSDILQYATDQLRSYIPAFLKDLREEYLIAKLTLTVTGPVVPAPARAVGAALRTLKWRGSDGRYIPIPRTEPERAGDFCTSGSCPRAYYFEGNNIVLLPAVSSGTLQLAYQQRPGELVLPTACARITAVDYPNQQVTVASRPGLNAAAPSSFGGTSATYDLVGGTPNFVAYSLDFGAGFNTPIAFTGNIGQFNDPVMPLGISVGDYLCLADETCIPQLPIELHDLVAQSAAAAIANATGSSRKDSINDALTKLEAQLTSILSPRNDGSGRAIVNRSSIGWRRGL